jgi:hypothetical protein
VRHDQSDRRRYGLDLGGFQEVNLPLLLPLPLPSSVRELDGASHVSPLARSSSTKSPTKRPTLPAS